MPVSFEGFNLYDTNELGDLVANSGKQINLRALNDPRRAGQIIVVLDGAHGFTNENAEGVIGVIRESGQTAPAVFPTSDDLISYITLIRDLYPTINIAI
ncbi:hypothetical protein [Burkholderia glumae]|uniref:hypothetical protein n=1 Tax=Burkholderia glumae TaxID=337 RepID=UPI0021508C3E|nr:hypothetical protein [Burkholderia glumae]